MSFWQLVQLKGAHSACVPAEMQALGSIGAGILSSGCFVCLFTGKKSPAFGGANFEEI
jgi:hypothetical protein